MATKPRPKSGYYGVSAKGKKWGATISHAGERHYLGTFRTREEAAAAHDAAARQHRSGEGGVAYNFESAEAGQAAAAEAAEAQVPVVAGMPLLNASSSESYVPHR